MLTCINPFEQNNYQTRIVHKIQFRSNFKKASIFVGTVFSHCGYLGLLKLFRIVSTANVINTMLDVKGKCLDENGLDKLVKNRRILGY